MPCGGIWPASPQGLKDFVGPEGRCFHCHELGPDHWVEEWDAFIHGKCVESFLDTDEGDIVISHQHIVLVKIDGEVRELYKEDVEGRQVGVAYSTEGKIDG